MTDLGKIINKHIDTHRESVLTSIDNITNEYYQIGIHSALGYLKAMIDNNWDNDDMIEYINKTIENSSEELKLIYLEASITIKNNK